MVYGYSKNSHGFTLIEIMLVIAIIMIIFGIVLQSGKSLNTTVELENASRNVDLKIRTAKARSIGALDDKNYGVHLESSKAVIFDATGAYADGAAGNEVFVLPNSIEISSITLSGGGSDIIFQRLTGNISTDGNFVLRVKADTTKTKTIFVNSYGQSSFSSFASSTGPLINNARHTHFDLGWYLDSPTLLSLKWYNGATLMLDKGIDTAAYFDPGTGVFDWEGTINESGINQKISIRGWKDPITNNTILCVIRHNNENNKLMIYFTNSGEKHIATYENAAGVISVVAGTHGGTKDPQ